MGSKKIKVCHVVATLDTGGMENGVVNIANGLDRDIFEPVVLCVKAKGTMAKRLSPDVELISLNSPGGKQPLRFVHLGQIFKKRQVSIVHTHGWGGCSFDGIMGAKWGRVPYVVNGEHGTFFLRPQQVFVQKMIYGMCDANLSVSESLKERVTKKLGTRAEKITTITNGVDCERFNGAYQTQELERALDIESSAEGRLVLGNIGSLKPSKNQKLLLQAVGKLIREHPGLRIYVLLIGDGPDRAMLQNLVKELGLEDIVRFAGLRSDIPELLSIIDVLVAVSTSEGMSNVTLEAFASGVPIITTAAAGMEEIVRDGVTGYMLEDHAVDTLANRILQVYRMPRDELRSMGKSARAFVIERHSIGKMIRDYENFYLDLMGRRS